MSKRHRHDTHRDRQSMKRSVDKYIKSKSHGVCGKRECVHNENGLCASDSIRCEYEER